MSIHHPDCDTNDVNAEGIKKPCNCPVKELLANIDAEILEDEGAIIHATNHGQWERRGWLEGHKLGLLKAKELIAQ